MLVHQYILLTLLFPVIQVAFSNLYSGASAADKCTLYSDRNLVNRRNVKGDVTAAANACRRFFQLEVEARVIAAAIELLGMTSLEDAMPTKNLPPNPDGATSDAKKAYLRRIATLVVDSYIIDRHRNEKMRQSVAIIQYEAAARQQELTADGRFRCRAPGCRRSFAHDGKLRRDHEAGHIPPVVIDPPPPSLFVVDSVVNEEDRDDMLSYQKALLEYGMLILNFWDAISEGDGDRVIRCWKFFLLYLKHQGGAANKYALEALYLMFQIYALLSPQAAHRLIWNRSAKNKPGASGNIPLDLLLEFFNKFVKEAIKKLGPSATRKSLDRICHSLNVTSDLMLNFDNAMSVFKRSGRHVQKSVKGDLTKIVNELTTQKAFHHTPSRKYQHYANIKPSILSGFNMQKMFHWIEEHKKHMILHRRAR